MRKTQKIKRFCALMLVGVLGIGTPISIYGEEPDHSGEGQITAPEKTGKELPADDATDNTYDYYTVMGDTTVTAEDMVLHFNQQNLEYPSDALSQGGAPDVETFCEIVVEEADAEGVRGEIVFEQAMLETGWLQFQ